MAILDDPEWLLRYIRHSFITSDDTGMCEMVIQDNDLLTLDEHKQQIREKKLARLAEKKAQKGLSESFGQSTSSGSPRHFSSPEPETSLDSSLEDLSPLAPSPDILSGWDFGVRRRSNTAQKLERIRKERQNRIKVNSTPWRKRNAELTEEQVSSMFPKKNLENDEKSPEKEHIPPEPGGLDTCNDLPGSLNPKTISTTTTVNTNSKFQNKHFVHYGFDSAEVADGHSDIKFSQNETSNHTEDTNGDRSKPDLATMHGRTLSALSEMLLQSSEQYNNPFREYSKFNAQGNEGTAAIKKMNIFIWPFGAERPKFSMQVAVLAQGAKVQDVVGLTCWQYTIENQEPKLHSTSVQKYSLHIAEDDGTVDSDFPALEPTEPIAKFGFPTLTLVEKPPQPINSEEDDSAGKNSVFVKVNDHAGFSLIMVEDLSITMGEILKKTIKRRKGQNYLGKYNLEYQDREGETVSENQTLESTGVMEFHLVREHSSRSNSIRAFEGNPRQLTEKIFNKNENDLKFATNSRTRAISSPGDNSFVFVPTLEYQTFRLYLLHKVRPSTSVAFGVGPNQVDVEPVHRRESRSAISQLLSPRVKSLSIRVTMLAYCAIHESKNGIMSTSLSTSPSSSSGGNSFSSSGVSTSFATLDNQSMTRSTTEKLVFKLYYKLSEAHHDFKHLTLEGSVDEVRDAVDRVKTIMMLGGNGKLQNEFEVMKFGTTINSSSFSKNNAIPRNRKGSLFK